MGIRFCEKVKQRKRYLLLHPVAVFVRTSARFLNFNRKKPAVLHQNRLILACSGLVAGCASSSMQDNLSRCQAVKV